MGIFLEKIEVENYRGLSKYSIEGFLGSSSITGSNSTGKSTLINAISLLGSNKMHTVSDIPAYFRPTRVASSEISVKVSYLFRLTSNFLDLMSDERVVESLILSYEDILKNRPKTEDNAYRSLLETELQTIKSKPLREILADALYSTIKEFKAKYPGNPTLYQAFLDPSGAHIRSVEDVLNEAKYICIRMELSIAEGPQHGFFLLNKEKQPIVSDDVFYHWLQNTRSIDPIFFAFIIGAVFVKSVTNPPFHKEEGVIPPSILASDGSNLEEFIEYCLKHNSDKIAIADDDFRRIFRRSIKIKKPRPGSYSEETKIVVKLGDKDEWFPLEKLSDGMLHTLRILLQLESCHNGDILMIDEPELHLHPGAARSLRAILLNKKTEVQVICATHSPIFIDPSYADTIILHRISEAPRTLQSKDIDAALMELGSSGLDAILYDVVIWYEGPSDKEYIEKWLHLLSGEIEIQLSDIGLIHFGGKGNLEHIDPEIIKRIARKSIFIVDSDKNHEQDPLNRLTAAFAEKCSRAEIPCWITKRREIENYIPNKVLRETLRIPGDTFQVNPYDNIFEKLQANGRSIRKHSLARSVAYKITLSDIQADTEIYNELKEKLIGVLNSFMPS
jgi:energy-coupling factor transporter ATP-binding protein EcfA2